MSNYLAVATVTTVFRRSLLSVVGSDTTGVTGATVTAVRPAEGQNTGLPTGAGVNVFLYQVTPNPHRRNADLPMRGPEGRLAHRPQAAIDLHYLLSFYGSESSLEPQRLLGSAIAHLHSQPLLTRAAIEAAVTDPTLPYLSDSNLADQVDSIRFVPVNLSLDDLSRLWSVFFQIRYVLSVVYQASVVLLEPKVTVPVVLPIRDFNLRAVPLRQPYIRRVVAQAGEDEPIVSGTAVYVEGHDLHAGIVAVEVNGGEAPTGQVRDDRIALTLPAGLQAGVQRIQVRHGVRIGAPAERHLTFSSNLGSFVLQPRITMTGTSYDIAISDVNGAGASPRTATVTVNVEPAVGVNQQVTLEMLANDEVAYTFAATARTSETASLSFSIRGVAAGDYVFRVRVDGADSPIELDADRRPIAPKGTIP